MTDNKEGGRLIPFTIDGVRYETGDLSQRAIDLLVLAGLDPEVYDLVQLLGKDNQRKKYGDYDRVQITKDARFVSLRQSAPVS